MEANGRSTNLMKFFSEMSGQGRPVVQEEPKLDLELYIHNYKGRTRFDRLYHIGRTSTVLCVDALKAAIADAKGGKDVSLYRNAIEALHEVAPEEPEAQLDKEWIDGTDRANKKETTRLENELRGYKNNLVKESVRIGNEDLGRHCEAIGALQKAVESYSNMRPDASTSKHLVDIGRHLIRVAIQMRDWSSVTLQAGKIAGLVSPETADDAARYVKVTRGIAALHTGAFEDAARAFTSIPPTGDRSWSDGDVASANDVAVYGAILGLATMERHEIRGDVLESGAFRPYLELEPHLRKALGFYVNGKYKACLEILEAYRADYMLDVHLYKHIPALYGRIRSKCIVQYLIPYSYISMESLEQTFGRAGEPIVKEICGMIRSGALDARINSIDKQLVMLSPDPRMVLQKDALEAARWYRKQAMDRMRMISLAGAGLEVRGTRRDARMAFAAGIGGVDDGSWSDGRDAMDLVM